MDKVKQLGQVMTPPEMVDYILGILELSEEQKENCLFVDPSCGNGAFILGLLRLGVPKEHIFACDIDASILEPVYEMLPRENIVNESLFLQEQWKEKFDFVVGNPPYVTLRNILPEVREQIKDFHFCWNMYDLSWAFFEFGLKLLKPEGSLIFISENNFIYNKSAKYMRKYIDDNKLLRHMENFEHKKMFDKVLTYTCICMLSKDNKEPVDSPWEQKREEKHGLPYKTLGFGSVTIKDSVYIADTEEFDKLGIEKAVRFPICKASTGEMKEIILIDDEETLRANPNAHRYLSAFKDELTEKATKYRRKWFQATRNNIAGKYDDEKIAISLMIDKEKGMKLTRLGKGVLVYSGGYATADDLDKLDAALRDRALLDYLIPISRIKKGNFIAFGVQALQEY